MSWRAIAFALALAALLAPAACTVPDPTAPAPGGGGIAGTLQAGRPTMTPYPTEQPTGLGSIEQPLVMTFVPKAAEGLEADASAQTIARLLSDETGFAVESQAAGSYGDALESLTAGAAHLAWLDALHYLIAREASDVQPLLILDRDGEIGQAGQIVVAADSGIDTLDDLVGQRFCRPDVAAAAGWILPMLTLKAFGVEEIDFGETLDVDGDEAVVRAIYDGRCDVGSTAADARDALESELPDVKEVVTVLAVTGKVPNLNVSAIARLSPAEQTKISDGLMALSMTPDGRDALLALLGGEAFQPADDSLYDELRAAFDKADTTVDEVLTSD